MRNSLSVALIAILYSCATARVSTQEERDAALATLATAESVLLVLIASDKISDADYQAGLEEIRGLRALVAKSETTPINWLTAYQEALNLLARWVEIRNRAP